LRPPEGIVEKVFSECKSAYVFIWTCFCDF